MTIPNLKKSGGFTLLELMVIVGIIGILAAMGIPAWQSMMPHFRIKTAARETSNMVHQARMQAVADNKYTEIKVNYSTETIRWRVLPDGVWNNVAEKWKDIDVFKAVDPTYGEDDEKAIPFPDDILRFRPDGTAVMGEEQLAVYLQNKKNPEEWFRVRVTASGTIKVQQLVRGHWR